MIGEAAIVAGCRFYAGYPITPQNELPEYVSKRFAEMEDATFVQAESELAAINMVMGASMAGVRAMTSSSSPGISLKQEGISYIAGMELPAYPDRGICLCLLLENYVSSHLLSITT